jgi:virginiamycin B lyase
MLLILAAGVVTVLALMQVGGALTVAPARGPRAPAAATGTALPAGVMAAPVRVFPMPEANADLMQPAVDAKGHVWFGEMGTNRLARLDPRTGKVTEWTPPHGQFGIMDIAVAQDGGIWFTEQTANYIGRFDPATGRFQTYPLAVHNGRSAAPQDLAFDAHGRLWFTEVSLAAIGRLDPATGSIQTWNVPAAPGSQTFPYALAITSDGAVWFAELAGGTLGRLDPASGQVRLYHTPTADAQIFSLAAAPDGRLWFSELQYGRLATLDPRTGAIHEYTVPTRLANNVNLYEVAVATNGDVWAASLGQNAIVRFAPAHASFTLYPLPDAASLPYGLTLDASGQVWFTADRAPINYVGMLRM